MLRKSLFIILLIIACAAIAQPPPGPKRNYLAIQPGSQQDKKSVSGDQVVFAMVPSDVTAEKVVFYVDGGEVGASTNRPYYIAWNSASVSNGDHFLRWVAVDAEGAELSSGTTDLAVSNNDKTSENPPDSESSEEEASDAPSDDLASISEYAKYSNADIDVSFEYPAQWTVKDNSEGVPSDWEKGYWLVISTEPIAQSICVVNLRHRLLKQEHTAESFAKYTPYVADWDKESINGRPAFITTAGKPEDDRVVHRVMMLDGRRLYMLNCIDTSGGAVSVSRAILMRIVQSIGSADNADIIP